MEWQDELGLNLYDMDMRDYDPAIGRWTGIDPVTHHSQSTYNAFDSNPVSIADPSGADGYTPGGIGGEVWGQSYGSYYSSPYNGAGANFSGQYGGLMNPVVTQDFGSGIIRSGGAIFYGSPFMQYQQSYAAQIARGSNGKTVSVGPVEELATDDGTMASAVSFAATAASLDGPFPYGDIVGLVAVAGVGTYLYSGDLIEKMTREIEGIQRRTAGPPGFQYALTATRAGEYPNVRGGTTFLNAGDVWKYGETTNSTRYSQKYLTAMGLRIQPQFFGNQVQIKIQEKVMIYGYYFSHGSLPPGNSIFR